MGIFSKKITYANPNGLQRLKVVQKVQQGALLKDVAQEYNVHYTTVREWCDMYEQGGVERLNAPIKPRPTHTLCVVDIEAALAIADEKYHARLNRLLRLAKGEQLKTIAESEDVSVQAIMKDRKKFEDGELPPAK